jgi:glycosyltransferase involved in cell wall biosynthesis
MTILHVVALIQASTGGPAVSVTRLASEQAKLGHEVTLACLDYPHLGPQVAAPGVRVVSVKGNIVAVRGRGWSPKFKRVVMEEAARADIVHNHGLWMWPNAYAREAAVAAGKPLVISPRGMLESWSLGRSRLRKAVAWRLFERKSLQSAAMFHATAESERSSIEEMLSHGLTQIKGRISPVGYADRTGQESSLLGDPSNRAASSDKETTEQEESHSRAKPDRQIEALSKAVTLKRIKGGGFRAEDLGAKSGSSEKTKEVPIVVAPNGVDLPALELRPERGMLEREFPELRGRRWVVFMSRLHPKKGLDVLLRAWRAQQNVEHEAYGIQHTEKKESLCPLGSWCLGSILVLAGSDLIGYRKDVERMVRELQIEDSVVITGEVLGKEKDCLLANADLFVLPSYSENFGIVVAEAMSWGRPVIVSTGTPWKEVADVGAGWWVKPEEGAIAGALAKALGKRPEELEAMGLRGRALVEERYTWVAPARKLIEAYSGLTGR